MVALRPLATVGAGLLMVAIGIVGSRAQEAQKVAPEQVLQSHDLKRTGTTWLLPGEAAILKDFQHARALSREIGEGIAQQQAFEYGSQERKGQVQQLRQQYSLLNEQVATLRQQIDSLSGATSNIYANQQRNLLVRQHTMLVAQLNQVTNQLNGLQEQSKDQDKDTKLQLNAEVGKTREKYMEAIFELRKAVDEITAKYDKLKNNPEVTKALASLSASTKSQHKLGPSKALADAIKLLKRSEGSVQNETIELQPEGGVFHVFATLNGKFRVKMVFDTGASDIQLPAKIAAQIGLKPTPTDTVVPYKIADGSTVKCRKTTIPTVRVGNTTVRNVECAVMPEAKVDVDPLLGQSFFKDLHFQFNPSTARLKISKVNTSDEPAADTKAVADSDAKDNPGAAAKTKRTSRQPKTASKGKRGARKYRSTDAPDGPMPEGNLDQPN